MNKESLNNKKSNRFNKVATKRVDLILKTLHLLSNCSNRNSYIYEEKDVKKIEELIEIPEIKVNNQVLSIFMNAAINCLGTSLDTKAHAFKPSRKSTNLTTGFVVGKIRIKGVVSG